MSLTAHPYVVLAEQQWKRDSLAGASLAARARQDRRLHTPPRAGRRSAARRGRVLRHVLRALHAGGSGGQHTPRPV